MPHPLATGMVNPVCAEWNGMACAAATPTPKLSKVTIATSNLFTAMIVLAEKANLRDKSIWLICARPAALVHLVNSIAGESGATQTPFPAQGGQQSGDCGQQVMAA